MIIKKKSNFTLANQVILSNFTPSFNPYAFLYSQHFLFLIMQIYNSKQSN